MSGFKLRISSVGSDRSTNRAKTTCPSRCSLTFNTSYKYMVNAFDRVHNDDESVDPWSLKYFSRGSPEARWWSRTERPAQPGATSEDAADLKKHFRCNATIMTPTFFHLLPKPHTCFHVRLIDGAARIFSCLLSRDRESNSCQFSCISLKGP